MKKRTVPDCFSYFTMRYSQMKLRYYISRWAKSML